MTTIRVHGACLAGAGAELVTVEARFEPLDRERSEIALTGLPDPVVRESRGRLTAALGEAGFEIPSGVLQLHLVPAGRKKTGEALDLALALGAAAAIGHLDPAWLAGTLFVGELGLDGQLHPVAGGLAAAEVARRAQLARVCAPEATAREAAYERAIAVHAFASLTEVVAAISGARAWPPRLDPDEHDAASARASGGDAALGPFGLRTSAASSRGAFHGLDAVRGHAAGKRALAAAAAGGHGLLFVGPPGTGKSLLARCLPELLPPPTDEEALEITRVLSAAGRWPGGLVRERPFRAPHHTVSYAGLVGGGIPVAPGEITLAHGGVLFLDELPEFRREALEALRQPLETGRVLISRSGTFLELPARFQVVCAMNPCPCGYLGHPRQPCRCPPTLVQRYRSRISGPLLDRIPLRVELPAPALDELVPQRTAASESATEHDESPRRDDASTRGAAIAASVLAAIERMRARQGARRNAELEADELDRCAPLDPQSRRLYEAASSKLGLSARAIQGLRRVARTLADLGGCDALELRHSAEALALRAPIWR
ncbi:MAG: ATP-binding protein [Planctomycetota bacterium]|nr:MAG: ATP-binding protein [Planctomycetota bacterium]